MIFHIMKQTARHMKSAIPYNRFIPLSGNSDIMTTHLSALGRTVHYPDQYQPDILQAIARAEGRHRIGLDASPAFHGGDIWNAYELSWLNARGKPVVALAEFDFPCDTPCLIESKTFKLYLNSFNQTRFADTDTVLGHLRQDLGTAAGGSVEIRLHLQDTLAQARIAEPDGTCLDLLDIDIHDYHPAPALLQCLPEAPHLEERLYSRLLRSNCPVTGQPDWGHVEIHYRGRQIDHAGLLRYIVSFRLHTGFHELCVEQIYNDIMGHCHPDELFVYARYTRRGGLDINPWRASHARAAPPNVRSARQ